MNVLISGGGIAGPTLAFWLTKYGFRPTIVERAEQIRQGGQAVDFRGVPQLQVLTRMNLLPAIKAAQTGMGDISIVNARGRRQSRIPAAAFSGDVEILRGDLGQILYEATRNDTEYVFDDTITALHETQEGIEATFANSPMRTFDLVVGADGTRSNVRRIAFGDASKPHHLGIYTGIFSTPNTFGLDRTGLMYSRPGRSATILGTTGAARIMLDFASPEISVKNAKDTLHGHFVNDGWRIPELLKAMWQSEDFYFDAASQVILDRYTRGRVALLGDAAYSPGPGGMGTGLAVVGAYILAGELARGGPDALARYERKIRPYAEVCQKQAKGGARFLVPRSDYQIWARNQSVKVMSLLPLKKMMAKVANAITLEDYS